MRTKQVSHTRNEQAMLQAVQHPFIINLWGTFQDSANLYMVMDFVPGGELFTLLRRSNVSGLSARCVCARRGRAARWRPALGGHGAREAGGGTRRCRNGRYCTAMCLVPSVRPRCPSQSHPHMGI